MKRIIPIILIAVVAGAIYWWVTQPTVSALRQDDTSNQLLGSGTIEAETLAITAELGGRVVELNAEEGDEVTADTVLIQLDTTDLLAQQAQLEAAIATAKANLELVSAPPRLEDVRLAEARLAQAEQIEQGSLLVWQQAQRLVDNPHELDARINQMKARITDTEKQLETAKVTLKRADIQAEAASRNQKNNAGLAANEAAQYQLLAAQEGVKMAETVLAGTQKQVEHLVRLRNQPLTLIAQANAAEAAYTQAQAAVLAAQANLLAAKADPTPEDVNIARAQLRETETALTAVEVQLDKQTLTAPRDGLISQKLVNPGELAAPGVVLLELSDIETVDLTVYIPETQIGRVQVGQKAAVFVDAYPDDEFEGQVTFIAHEAEFTPRNVQTQEQRVNLVFAVKITLNNGDHRLKPGMPADAEILPEVLEADAEKTVAPEKEQETEPLATPVPTEAASPTPIKINTPTATPTPAPSAPQIEVLSWGLKVRSQPGIDAPAFAHLSKGDIVPVIGVDAVTGWLEVELPTGETGWVTNSATFVSVVQ